VLSAWTCSSPHGISRTNRSNIVDAYIRRLRNKITSRSGVARWTVAVAGTAYATILMLGWRRGVLHPSLRLKVHSPSRRAMALLLTGLGVFVYAPSRQASMRR